MNFSTKHQKKAEAEFKKERSKTLFSLPVVARLIESIEQGFETKNRNLTKKTEFSSAVIFMKSRIQTSKKCGEVEHLKDLLKRAEMLRKKIAFDALISNKSTLEWMIKRKMPEATINKKVYWMIREIDGLKRCIEDDLSNNTSPRIKDELDALKYSLAEFEVECLMIPEPSYFKDNQIQQDNLDDPEEEYRGNGFCSV